MMQLEDSLGIAALESPSRDGHHAELLRLTAELVDSSGHAPSRPAETCPVDRRIESFLNAYFADLKPDPPLRLPARCAGPAPARRRPRAVAPRGRGQYVNDYVRSYRVRNGVLHNPAPTGAPPQACSTSPRAACRFPGTRGPCPGRSSPLCSATPCHPPAESAGRAVHGQPARAGRGFVSLLLRPIVCPEVPGVCPRKTMEIRFFAPGSLVSNLDFVESIFGNAGDPYLPENDAGAGRRALDRPHRLRHPRPAPDPADQEGARPAALGRGHRAPAPRRHVLARTRASCTTTAAPSS